MIPKDYTPRHLMQGNRSRCLHTFQERICPRYYKGLPAFWCQEEIPDCVHRRTNIKGEGVCTRTCPRRKE